MKDYQAAAIIVALTKSTALIEQQVANAAGINTDDWTIADDSELLDDAIALLALGSDKTHRR